MHARHLPAPVRVSRSRGQSARDFAWADRGTVRAFGEEGQDGERALRSVDPDAPTRKTPGARSVL